MCISMKDTSEGVLNPEGMKWFTARGRTGCEDRKDGRLSGGSNKLMPLQREKQLVFRQHSLISIFRLAT